MTDYQTALGVITSDGKPNKDAVVSSRAYLADAAFLVGLEGDDAGLLEGLQASLLNPRWPLALGRRAFAPSLPVAFSAAEEPAPIVEAGLEAALVECPPIVETRDGAVYRYHIEHPDGDQEWFDQPADDFTRRTFRPRRVLVREGVWGEPWS